MVFSFNERDYNIPISDSRYDEQNQSNSKKYVYEMMNIANLRFADLVRKLNNLYPDGKYTSQNLSNKLQRGGLRDFELAQVANACGYELLLSHKDFYQFQQAMRNSVDDNTNYKLQQYLLAGKEIIDTKFNGVLVIAGENAEEAARVWILHCATADALTELGYARLIEKQFDVITRFVSNTISD